MLFCSTTLNNPKQQRNKTVQNQTKVNISTVTYLEFFFQKTAILCQMHLAT